MGYSYLYGLTTTRCGAEGGCPGLEFGLEGALSSRQSSISLGRSIATSPVLAPPMLYIQKPEGGGDGSDMEKPTAIRIPINSGQLLHWREVD